LQVFIVINVTAFNDFQKERQFRALKETSDKGKAVAVIRDNQALSFDVRPEAVVVGDVVEAKAGDVLGADGILIEGTDITCDESVMSGESKARTKDPVDVPWLFSGTSVQTGQGRMLVTAVGVNSAEGVINT
jgi:Ca2+ transporting ATPase